MGIGFALFAEVLGIYFEESAAYWTILLLIYFFLILIFTSVLYHSGEWSLELKLFKQMPKSIYSVFKEKRFKVRESENIFMIFLRI